MTRAADYGHFSLVKHLFDKYNCDLKAKNKVSVDIHKSYICVNGTLQLCIYVIYQTDQR